MTQAHSIDYSHSSWLKLLLLMAVLLLTPLSSYAAQALAVINGDTITTEHIDALIMQHHQTASRNDKMNLDYHKLLSKSVNDLLIIQESRAMGFADQQWLHDRMQDERLEYAWRTYAKAHFKPDLTISRDELVDYLNEYYFMMQVRTVSVTSMEQANDVAEKIKGGASMDSIAQDVSVDSKRYQGGLRNLKYYADTERLFREAAMKIELGELAPPIPFKDAFVVLRLEQLHSPDTAHLSMLGKKLTGDLKEIKRIAGWEDFVDSLSAIAQPVVIASSLNDIYEDSASLFTPEFILGKDTAVVIYQQVHQKTTLELRKDISYSAMSDGTALFSDLVNVSLEGLTTQGLMEYFAITEGYLDDPYVVERYNRSFDSTLIELYLNETVVSQIKFNKEEFEEYYNAHTADFQEPMQYLFEEVHLATEDSAKLFKARLDEGASFAYLTNKFDSDGHKSKEDEWITLSSIPPNIREDLRVLSVGQSSGPLETTEGWIILHLKNQKEGRIKSMQDVDMDLRKIMFQKRFNELLEETLALQTEHSSITYFDDAIEQYFEN